MRVTRNVSQNAAYVVRIGLVLLTAGSCADNVTAPVTAADVVGTWSLVSVGGKALPAPYIGPTVVTSDVYTFAADGTYTDDGETQNADGTGASSDVYGGTWTVDGARAYMHTAYHGTHDQLITDSLQIQHGGRTLVHPVPGGDWVV